MLVRLQEKPYLWNKLLVILITTVASLLLAFLQTALVIKYFPLYFHALEPSCVFTVKPAKFAYISLVSNAYGG